MIEETKKTRDITEANYKAKLANADKAIEALKTAVQIVTGAVDDLKDREAYKEEVAGRLDG